MLSFVLNKPLVTCTQHPTKSKKVCLRMKALLLLQVQKFLLPVGFALTGVAVGEQQGLCALLHYHQQGGGRKPGRISKQHFESESENSTLVTIASLEYMSHHLCLWDCLCWQRPWQTSFEVSTSRIVAGIVKVLSIGIFSFQQGHSF